MIIKRDSSYSILLGKRINSTIIKSLSDEDIFFKFLHLTSDVGALPILPWISYLYRGHPDDLTTFTSMICIGSENDCTFCQKIIEFLYDQKYKKGPGNPELILTNPTAVNIEAPSLINTIMRNELENVIIDRNRNIHLRQLFKPHSKREEEKFYKCLISTTPFFPRVMHVIVMSSALGAKLGFISQFYNTRTTQSLFKGEISKILDKIKSSEESIMMHWIKFVNAIDKIQPCKRTNMCSTMLAQKLRDDSWRDTLKVEIRGVTVPHPIHQLKITKNARVDHRDCIGDKEFILFTIPEIDKSKIVTTRGPYPPYIGSRTREKITGKIYQLPQRSRPLEGAHWLTQLKNWCVEPESELAKLIDSLIENRTNISKNVLQMTSGSIVGGSHIHRLNDHVTKKGTLNNFRPNITTHIYISSDELGKYSRGEDNYNMHIQGFFHLGYSVLEYDAFNNNLNYNSMHMHIQCNHCNDKLFEMLITGGEQYESTLNWENNPLLYSKIENVPQFLDPSNPILCFCKSRNPAVATGALLMSRVIKKYISDD